MLNALDAQIPPQTVSNAASIIIYTPQQIHVPHNAPTATTTIPSSLPIITFAASAPLAAVLAAVHPSTNAILAKT